MEYSHREPGRIFYLRVDEGEDLTGAIRAVCTTERIACATVQVFGALREGTVVTGPRDAVVPPDPVTMRFENGWEILGFGTVFPGDEGPDLHLHVAMGRGEETRTGCLRGEAVVYLVVEVVITELEGVEITRSHDPDMGVSRPQVTRRRE
ncbi:MAG: PPC domain-containing DNA-binding protein [Methanomicrobiales archaeon]